LDLISKLGPLAFASRLKRISELLYRDVSRLYAESDVDFEARWFPVLYILIHKSPMAVTEIASELRLTHPAINQIAKQMIKKGYLVSAPDKSDERRHLLSLTKKGRNLASKLAPMWEDVAYVTGELLKMTGSDVLLALDQLEKALGEKGIYERVLEIDRRKDSNSIEIIDFDSRYSKRFKELNYEWLLEYFEVEEEDEKVLSDPAGFIIDKGGQVVFAIIDGEIIGTGALVKKDRHTYEITKMAVTNNARRKGAGRKILAALIDNARKLSARKLILETSPQLEPAIKLYESHGFVRIANQNGYRSKYRRPSIMMQLDLNQ